MAQACPLNYQTIDATIARINALWIALSVGAYLFTLHPFWLFLVGIDFSIRLYASKRMSLFYMASMGVKTLLKLPVHSTDAGAKRLAAHFGLLFSVLMVLGHFSGLDMMVTVVGVVFVSCAVMECLLDYCVGCKIYHLWRAMKPKEM